MTVARVHEIENSTTIAKPQQINDSFKAASTAMSSGGIKNKVVQDGDKEPTFVVPCKRRKLRSVTSGMDSDDDWISTVNAGIMTPSKVLSKNRKEPAEEERAQEDTVTTDPAQPKKRRLGDRVQW